MTHSFPPRRSSDLGRFSEATFSPGIRPSDFTPEQITGMKGRVAQQIVMRPGDILYLPRGVRSEEHTSELQSLMRISYAVFCLKKQIHKQSNIPCYNLFKYTFTVIHVHVG